MGSESASVSALLSTIRHESIEFLGRPGVAWAVLQTVLSLIHSLIMIFHFTDSAPRPIQCICRDVRWLSVFGSVDLCLSPPLATGTNRAGYF